MDSDKYHINSSGLFQLNDNIPELQYIPRYLPKIDPNDKKEQLTEKCNTGVTLSKTLDISRTIQSIGWKIHLTNEMTITDEDGAERIIEVNPCNSIVTYCQMCQEQHDFIIVRERIKKSEKTGRTYIAGYYGYCMRCYDKLHGIKPAGRP